MIRLLALLLVFHLYLVTACVPFATRSLSEAIKVDTTWSGKVAIDGDLVVEEGATLTIRPGTEVVFLLPSPGRDRETDHPHFVGSELIVKGRLIAVGTAEEPITFRAHEATAPSGSWGGINLVRSPQTTIRHVRITQADSAVHSQESSAEISCSIFERNLVGIRFHSSPIRITNNRFFRNDTAIRFHFGAPEIRSNLLEGNRRGLFITAYPKDYVIRDNRIVASREASVVLGEEVVDDVDLRGNDWGEDDPLLIEREFFDGRRVDYLGKVRYLPLAPFVDSDAGVDLCGR